MEVHGDIGISVLSEDLSEEIAYFSYRNGCRPLYDDEFTKLIPDDKALHRLGEAGRLVWANNNWVEFIIRKQDTLEHCGDFLDDNVLDDNVLEAFDDIGWYIDRIKQIPGFGRETAKMEKDE